MDSQAENSRAAATYIVDAVVAVLVLIMGIVIVVSSRALGAEWTSDGPGSGYFPFYIGIILIISSLGIMYQALFSKAKNTETFADREQLGRVFAVLIPAVVYVGGIQVLGIYVASAIYIALFMIVMGKFHWVKSTVAAFTINVLFFLMFEVWFQVPLHKGSLDPLAFLGY